MVQQSNDLVHPLGYLLKQKRYNVVLVPGKRVLCVKYVATPAVQGYELLLRQIASLDCGVRLEFKPFPAEPMHLDIWLPGIGVAVELKYKTRKLNLLREGESFALREAAARDISRYDFLKDIQRLEQLRKLPNARSGFAVLLTNDPSYWKHPSRNATIDAAFSLHEGRTIKGEMAWSELAGAGTTKHREAPIRLNGSYDLHWQDYADMGDGHNRRFRYLAVRTSYDRSHDAQQNRAASGFRPSPNLVTASRRPVNEAK